jgi:hypothetical protein
MHRRRLVVLIAIVASLALTTTVAARPRLPGGMGNKRTVATDVAGYDKQHGPHGAFECTVLSGGANTNLDCDDPFPNNEPDVEVNPADPMDISVSSND